MGSNESSQSSESKEEEGEGVHLGQNFSVLHRIKLPFKGGQGREHCGFDHAYVEKKYLICGKMEIVCANPSNNVEKKELLDHLELNRDMTPQTFYLLCDTSNSKRSLPDPKFVRNLGTTKWILDANLKTVLKHEIRHPRMI